MCQPLEEGDSCAYRCIGSSCNGDRVQVPVGAALFGDVFRAVGEQDDTVDEMAVPVLGVGVRTVCGTIPAASRSWSLMPTDSKSTKSHWSPRQNATH